MGLSLKNYKTILSADLIKKAGQDKVWECDELSEGHFQAYVDEKNQTFDVSIAVNGKGELISSDCDCKSKTAFCRHKTALLLFVLKGKTSTVKLKTDTVKLKSTKKVNPLELLLEEADPQAIKSWLLEILTKNKELSIVFSHRFAPQKEQYTPAEIKQLTQDAVKAVINKRKKVDAVEVKKIVELWTDLHASVVEEYCAQPAEENLFLCLHAIVETCDMTSYNINTTSNRINKYQENILTKAAASINHLKDEDYWDKAVNYFVQHVRGVDHYLNVQYLAFLVRLHSLSSPERKKKMTIDLVTEYMKLNPREFYYGDVYTSAAFGMVHQSGLFLEYYHLFPPIRYKNEFNITLIGLLIEHNLLALAERYCQEQIAGNSREEYDEVYQDFLQEIYSMEGDDYKLAMVFKERLMNNFDFIQYLFICQQITDVEEQKQFRNSIYTRARHQASSNMAAARFSIKLLEFEEDYKKMVDLMNADVSYGLIIAYAPLLVLNEKDAFLKQIISRTDNAWEIHGNPSLEDLDLIFADLLVLLLTHYSDEELKLAIKARDKITRYSNKFVLFMKKSFCLN